MRTLAILFHIAGAWAVLQPLPIQENLAFRVWLCAGLAISIPVIVHALLTGFARIYLLVPLAIFWGAYLCRFVTDAYLDQIQLGYLSPTNYIFFLAGISMPSVAAGLAVGRLSKGKERWDFIAGGLIAAMLVSLSFGNVEETASLGRLQTGMTNPIWSGHLGVSAILVALYLMAFARSFSGFALAMFALPIGGVIILRSASRSPVIALGAGLALLIWAAILHKSKRAVLIFAVVAIAGVPWLMRRAELEDANIGRIALYSDNYFHPDSSSGRDVLFELAWEQFQAKPLTGYALEVQNAGESLFYPHNLSLEALMATGIVGGAPFILTAGAAFLALFWLVKSKDRIPFALLYAQALVLGSFSGALTSCFSFWFFLGTVLGFGTVPGRKRETKNEHARL